MRRHWVLDPWVAVLVAALVALVSACARAPDEASSLASARRHIDQREYAAAIIELKSALQARPRSGETRLLLGVAQLNAGDPIAAETELRWAMEYGVPEQQVLPSLATALLATHRAALLTQQFGKAQLSDNAAAVAFKTQVALAHADIGEREQAEAMLDDVLRRDPEYTPARLLRAKFLVVRGDLSAATALVAEITTKEPNNAQAWALTADLLQRHPQADTASIIAAYRKALSLRADLLPAHSALIALLIRQPDLEAASAQLGAMRKALARHPQTAYYDALLALLTGDTKRAQGLSQHLLSTSPDNPRVQLLASQIEMRLGSLTQAEAILKRAVAVPGAATELRHQLATVYLGSGQSEKALDTLRPLLGAANADAAAHSLAGQAHLLAGELQRADASFMQAEALRPGDNAIASARAMALLASGQSDLPLAELQVLAQADVHSVATDLALISAHMRRQQLQEALKAVDGLAVKQPKRPLPDYLRGHILAMRGESDAARKHFEQSLLKDERYFPAVNALGSLDQRDGKPDAARARYEAVLAREPQHARAMLAMARLARQRPSGGAEEAAMWLERAAKQEPRDPVTQLAVIDHYLDAGQSNAALAITRTAIGLMPDEIELIDRLGVTQLATGAVPQAIATFDKLVALRPNSARFHLRLADAHRAGKDAVTADQHALRALELAPAWPPAKQAGLAAVRREKRPAQALGLARNLQRRQANEAIGFQIEGDIEAAQGQWAKAVEAFQLAVTKANRGDAPARLHWALISSKKPVEAAQFEQAWLKQNPTDTGFALHLADSAMLHSDWPKAEAHYRRAIASRPDDAAALNNLAYLLLKTHKAGALALAERAVKLAPGQAAHLDTLAQALAQDKQIAKAIEWQIKAVAMAPESGAMRLSLAKLHLQAQDKAQAQTELNTLARRGTTFSAHAEVTQLLRGLGGS